MVITVDENMAPCNMTVASSPNKDVIYDENAPQSNSNVACSPAKATVKEVSTPLRNSSIMASPGKLSVKEEASALTPRCNVSIRASPGKLSVQEEGSALTPRRNLSIMSSPAPSPVHNMSIMSPAPSPGKLWLQQAFAALTGRGQKRTASDAHFSEVSEVVKVPNITEEGAREERSGAVANLQTEIVKAPHITGEKAEEQGSGAGVSLQTEFVKALHTEEGAVDEGTDDVAILQTEDSIVEHSAQTNTGEVAATVEVPATLESYKTSMDATTEVQIAVHHVQDANLQPSAEGSDVNTTPVETTVEWQDPTSGAMLGYVLCENMNADEAMPVETNDSNRCTAHMTFVDEASEGIAEWKDPISGALMGYAVSEDTQVDEADEVSEEIDVPLQLTVAWREPATGAMLGYALCDEGDKDLQAMQCLFHEETAEEPVTTEAGVVESDNAPPCVSYHDGYSSDAENGTVEESAVEASEHQIEGEWKDPTSGVAMSYACDEDSDFGDHVEMKPETWEDPETGATLGYAPCDDAELELEEEELFEAQTPYEEEPEDASQEDSDESGTGEMLGYGACEDVDSDFGEFVPRVGQTKATSRTRITQGKKTKLGASKKRFQPLALRLHKQHRKRVVKHFVRRVLKSRRMRQ